MSAADVLVADIAAAAADTAAVAAAAAVLDCVAVDGLAG